MNKDQDILSKLKYQKPKSPGPEYFEQIAMTVIELESSNKTIPLFKRPVLYIGLSIAASIVLFFGIYIGNSSETGTDTINVAQELSELEQDQVLAYIDKNIDDFDVELISEFATDLEIHEDLIPVVTEEVEVTLNNASSIDEKIDEINSEEILQYLKEQGIDPNDIEELEFI